MKQAINNCPDKILIPLTAVEFHDISRFSGKVVKVWREAVRIRQRQQTTRALRHSDIISSVSALEECIIAICQWMSANRLKLNAEKTELMWAGTRYCVAKYSL